LFGGYVLSRVLDIPAQLLQFQINALFPFIEEESSHVAVFCKSFEGTRIVDQYESLPHVTISLRVEFGFGN
jgi:hypothetical protein